MLEGMEAWDVLDRTEEMNIINLMLDFKLKCLPDGLVYTLKGRFCARGYQKLGGVDLLEICDTIQEERKGSKDQEKSPRFASKLTRNLESFNQEHTIIRN